MRTWIRYLVLIILLVKPHFGSTYFQALDLPPNQPPNGFTTRFHPDGSLQVGDLISLDMYAPAGKDLKDSSLEVDLESSGLEKLGDAPFTFDSTGVYHTILLWFWDTHGLSPGSYNLIFIIHPSGESWQDTVQLQNNPNIIGKEGYWATADNQCCEVHYITGTDAERDLPSILKIIDKQATLVENQWGVTPSKKLKINLIPRVLGNGGFTTDEISVTYLDQNYADCYFPIIIHHELVHLLDQTQTGKIRPSILVEGVAVYLSGGHYKSEPLIPRAAALLNSGSYIPINILTDNFYNQQHETSYLEAGALVEYLVKIYGWQAFINFYHDINPVQNGSQSQILNIALQSHFDINLEQLDDRFTNELSKIQVIPDLRDDVRLTILLYDAIRAYQQQYDPSAYFLRVWMPSPLQMRQRGIVADYVRHPISNENQMVETLLVSAEAALNAGDYQKTQKIIGIIQSLLLHAQS
ncbi:MAG TPA: hypothetical protein VKF38_06180 [Anaerolineaceae bacterium]|nr:hypothetical protein [Anaerolineaceae bacterium]